MKDYQEYYQESMEALEQYIEKTNAIITEKEWNKIALEKGLLTCQSISYLSEVKFSELCKIIYKEMRKKKQNEKRSK